MRVVEVRLLGPVELRVDGAAVRLPGAAERALLALLVLSPGRAVAATSLVDKLWSESVLPADPLNALQLRVSKLRRALAADGLDLVHRDGSGYRADVDRDQVDLHRFARLVQAARDARRDAAASRLALYEQALSLWRGEPLAEFAGHAWATVEAARLHALHLAAVTERAEAALDAGRHVEVVGDLEPLLAQDPKQEALAALLMTALYRCERQAEALEVFERTRRHLDDELGLQPSSALRALHLRVLQQDEALAAVPAAPPAPPAPAAEDVPSPAALPVPTLRLIGRDGDAAQVADALRAHRLVTLVGPGGAGKTSLALAVAHDVAPSFGRHVHLARLAAARTPADVPLLVAEALGVPLDGADPNAQVRPRLLAFVANRRLLLVLDNCEHVVDAVARLVDDLLGASAGLTVLATSREALAVRAEVQVAVAPLPVPPPECPPDEVLGYAAAALFLERARAVRADACSADELPLLAEVCRRLDGIPLALELAAARLSSLSLAELASRLGDRFRLLTSGPRTAEARQRTLRATVEWSHALLTEPERQVLRRLAVFEGGWTLDAAEAVVAFGDVDAAAVLDLLDQLVHRSMVTVDPGAATRYGMLETLRQHALEQLDASGEREVVAARHAACFRRLADACEQRLRGRDQRAALRQLRQEHANLRAALAWLTADPERVEDALHLAGALALFWHLGRHVEGRDVLARVVALPGGSRHARARALQAVSVVERPRACLVHPSPRCAETAQQSLELFLAEGDLQRAALSKVLLAVELLDGQDDARLTRLLAEAEEQFALAQDDWAHAVVAFVRLQGFLRRGDERRARAVGRRASEAFDRLDDAWGSSAVLYHLGWGLKEFGAYADAVPVLERAVELAASAGVFNTVQWALSDLGTALLALGQREQALAAFARAAAASQQVGDAAGVVLAALGRATVARVDGDAQAARPLFAEAVQGLERLQTPLWAGHARAGLAWCDWHDGLLDEAREGYERVRAEGEAHGEPVLVAGGIEGLARVAAARGEHDVPQLLADAAAVRSAASRPAPPHERAELDALRAGTAPQQPVRDALDLTPAPGLPAP